MGVTLGKSAPCIAGMVGGTLGQPRSHARRGLGVSRSIEVIVCDAEPNDLSCPAAEPKDVSKGDRIGCASAEACEGVWDASRELGFDCIQRSSRSA